MKIPLDWCLARSLLFRLVIPCSCLVFPLFAQEETQGPVAAGAAAVDEYQAALDKPMTPGNGRFVGIAYDSRTGKRVYGVGIEVVEIQRFTLTDEEGRFIIDDIPPGTYSIKLSQSGYNPITISDVNVTVGQVTKLADTKGALEQRPVEEADQVYTLDAIEVVAELVEEGMAGQLFDRSELASMISSMGQEQFSRASAGDVGEAVSHMAGANVVDGKYAVIRGLGDRYSNTTMNGAYIPSADPSKKAVQLDLIPTHLVKNLQTYKTFTPDLPAEFSGGAIDIQTIKFPEELTIKVGVGMDFNENTTGEKIYINRDRDMNFFGGSSDRFPGELDSTKTLASAENRNPNPNSERQQQAAYEMELIHNNGSFKPKTATADPGKSMSFTYGNTVETEMGKVGAILAFTQGQKYSLVEGRIVNRGSNNQGSFGQRSGQIQNTYGNEITWGGLSSISWQPNDDHQVSFTYLTYSAAQDEVKQGRNVVDDEKGNIASSTADGQAGFITEYLGSVGRFYSSYDEIGYLFRSQDTVQLDGQHNLGFINSGVKLDWIFSFSNAIEDRPDQRHLNSYQINYADPTLVGNSRADQSKLDPSLGSILTLTDLFGNNPSSSYREYLTTEENLWQLKSDLTFPVWERDDEHKLELKTGYSFSPRLRAVRGNFYQYRYASGLRSTIQNNDASGKELYDNFDEVAGGLITGSSRGDSVEIVDLTRSGNTIRNVDAFSRLNSAYLMENFQWGGLRLIGGFRFEREERSFNVISGLNAQNLVDFLNPDESDVNSYALPALSLVYNFGKDDQHEVRLAYGRTIARPTFYEYAPIITVDQATGLETRGNQNLVDTEIDNFDFRYEWRPSPDELVSLSLFYKNMSNPIVTTVGTLAGSKFFRSWGNSASGTLRGVELELEKRFGEHWSIGANGTYIDSLIDPLLDENGRPVGSAAVFEGQPEWIFNLNLGYDDDDLGIKANLLYNYTSEILTNVSESAEVPNIFKASTFSLDFVFSKEWESGWKFKFAAKNLLDTNFEQFYEGQSLIYDSYNKGRSYSFGLSYDY